VIPLFPRQCCVVYDRNLRRSASVVHLPKRRDNASLHSGSKPKSGREVLGVLLRAVGGHGGLCALPKYTKSSVGIGLDERKHGTRCIERSAQGASPNSKPHKIFGQVPPKFEDEYLLLERRPNQFYIRTNSTRLTCLWARFVPGLPDRLYRASLGSTVIYFFRWSVFTLTRLSRPHRLSG